MTRTRSFKFVCEMQNFERAPSNTPKIVKAPLLINVCALENAKFQKGNRIGVAISHVCTINGFKCSR